MRNFTFLEFATFLAGSVAHIDRAQHAALDAGGQMVEDKAKSVLGTYEYGWPSLAPSTIDRKTMGDSPGLETGELRDSISRTTTVHDTCIGTDLPKGEYFELGTSRQPPRSFLAATLQRDRDEILEKIQHVFVRDLFGL